MEAQWQMGKEEKIKDTLEREKGPPEFSLLIWMAAFPCSPDTLLPHEDAGGRTGPVRGNEKLTSVGFVHDFRSP